MFLQDVQFITDTLKARDPYLFSPGLHDRVSLRRDYHLFDAHSLYHFDGQAIGPVDEDSLGTVLKGQDAVIRH
ncbi:MAG: hypothetical protein NTZ24_14155, partial [Deltaproteobacteria bacterium]|nr:hypothetical protein [Deltaproteobacteria bacterium]